MTRPRGLIMWGAAGQARVLCDLVIGQPYVPVAFVDREATTTPVPGTKLLRDAEELRAWVATYPDKDRLVSTLAIGWVSDARLELGRTMVALGIEPVTLIHHTAWIARDAEIGKGCQILAGARVCSGARVAANAIINTGVSIDHDSVIGEGSHATPGVIIAGEVTIGSNVFLGAGCIVLPRIKIGAGAIIGAGAVVTQDVPAGATAVGMPARVLNRPVSSD